MDNIKAIVTNKGEYVEIVMIDEENQPIGFRPLEENERLVEVGRYNDFVKPRYDEELQDFIETATPEEIENARPTQLEPAKDEAEILRIQLRTQEQRLIQIESDNLSFQDFILSTIGGL